MLLLSRTEKEKRVIELATEGKTTREIAKEVHISLKDIGKIIRKITGDEDLSEKEKEDEKEKQKRIKSLCVRSSLSNVQGQEIPCRCGH